MKHTSIFTEKFKPYRKRFIYQSSGTDLFGSSLSWQTADRYLTNPMIEQALTGLAIYGYYITHCPILFGLDVDDHYNKGEGYLLSIYEAVLTKFNGVQPSVVCRSPHGLHLYYFLDYPMPFALLEARLKLTLAGVPVEIKPTTKTGIRFPTIANFIDPVSFLPLRADFDTIINDANTYHPAELFTDITPEAIRSSLQDRKSKTLRLFEMQTIARIEAGFPCIYEGNTNEALCNLIPVYRTAGLTPEESAQRFYANLAPVYIGELRNYNRLLSRIRAFYKNAPDQLYRFQQKAVQLDFMSEQLAEVLASKVTGETETQPQRSALTKKRQTVRNAVLRLENWKTYIDAVKKDRQMCQYWNYLYPYFIKNTSEGYYPIPSGILLDIHTNYERWLLPYLLSSGYLEKSPYGYSAGYGTCLHYRINQDIT